MNNFNKNCKIVIVGGGAAGWMAALYINRHYPDFDITVIESKEIGILGAGEGTTPIFITLLDEIGITVTELVKNAKCTIKNGIKFTNWNNDNNHYYHGFYNRPFLDNHGVTVNNSITTLSTLEQITKGETLDSINYTALVSEANRVKFTPKNWDKITGLPPDLINPEVHFDSMGSFALHVDATLITEYFRKVAISRGIKIIDSIVTDLVTDENDYLTELNLKDNNSVKCDFVFDCTGFNRLIIGKHYKSEWESYKQYLPVNRAIAYTLPLDEDFIPPYTEAIAMKYGWMWKIPLQNRYGCGYVFDSSMTTDKDIINEINNFYGKEINIVRSFNFEPGIYKRNWINNCVSLGLASGFIEPLEATSIMSSVVILRTFVQHIKGLTHDDQVQKDLFNDSIYKTSTDIMMFVYFHYLTKREDTEFWKNFIKNTTVPPMIQKLLDNKRDITVLSQMFLYNFNIFGLLSWEQVGAGLQFFNQEEAIKTFEHCNTGIRKQAYERLYKNHLVNLNQAIALSIDHKKFLSYLESSIK